MEYQDRKRVDGYNFKQGWGVAAAVVLAAIVINLGVAYIHYTTSAKSPNDLTYKTVGRPQHN